MINKKKVIAVLRENNVPIRNGKMRKKDIKAAFAEDKASALKRKVTAALEEMGVPIKDGMVKKSDIRKACQE